VVLPFLRLREAFQLPGAILAREREVAIQHWESIAGIVVDRLLSGFQTVSKPLRNPLHRARRMGGSTIPRTGEVALTLDEARNVPLTTERHGQAR
jgi:two-component system chemotaxis sensor kinase CheA